MRLIKRFYFVVMILLSALATVSFGQKTITFPSRDGLTVSADLYQVNDTLPYIILCHLSEHSRGEYLETAPKLNALGFNCMAIDTRTGNKVNDIVNETAREALKQGKTMDFLDSEQDIRSAIEYVYTHHHPTGIILLGSSFSASLVMKIGVDEPRVNAIIALSPGEYFGDALSLKQEIKGLSKPLFVTSSKSEAAGVTTLVDGLPPALVEQFIPKEDGTHGSISLWAYNSNHEEYWIAIGKFLYNLYPRDK